MPKSLLPPVRDFNNLPKRPVSDTDTELHVAESRSTFASLCLVSKSFLHLARKRLYYRPFAISKKDTPQRMEKLVSSLQTNSILGSLVRILVPPSSTHSSLRLLLLNLCPQLIAFSLNSSNGELTIPQLRIALKPLVGVRKLSLVCPSSSFFDWRSFALEILAFPAFAALRELYVRTGEVNHESSGSTRLPLPLKSLVIDSSFETFRAIEPLLPDNMATLTSLTLSEVRFTSEELQGLLESLGSTIAFLSLGAHSRRLVIFAETYRNDYDVLPGILSHHFTRFRNLVSLALPHTQGPSLALLRVLVSSCRHLVELDFSGSLWTSDQPLSSALTAEQHFDLVFPQEAIISALQSLSKLKTLNLGYLMYSDEEIKGVNLRNALEGGGFEEVEWDVVFSDDPEDDDESDESDDSESDSEESGADSENDTEAPHGEEEEAEASA